jgi:hypothetical protein
MKSPEQFNFSKEKDQKEFEELPEKEKKEIVELSRKEALLINSLKEIHPGGGDLYIGGTESIDAIVSDDQYEAIAYSRHRSTAHRGGPSTSGITYRQAVGVYNGKNDIEIKPMHIWRDGENPSNDHPESHYSISELKEVDHKFQLTLENCAGEIEIYEIDFNNNESKLLKEINKEKYLESKEGKTNEEKIELIGEKIEQAMKKYNESGTRIGSYQVINFLKKTVEDLDLTPYYYSEPEEDKKWDDVFNNSKDKFLLIRVEPAYDRGTRSEDEKQRTAIFLADPVSLEIKLLNIGTRERHVASYESKALSMKGYVKYSGNRPDLRLSVDFKEEVDYEEEIKKIIKF